MEGGTAKFVKVVFLMSSNALGGIFMASQFPVISVAHTVYFASTTSGHTTRFALWETGYVCDHKLLASLLFVGSAS